MSLSVLFKYDGRDLSEIRGHISDVQLLLVKANAEIRELEARASSLRTVRNRAISHIAACENHIANAERKK